MLSQISSGCTVARSRVKGKWCQLCNSQLWFLGRDTRRCRGPQSQCQGRTAPCTRRPSVWDTTHTCTCGQYFYRDYSPSFPQRSYTVWLQETRGKNTLVSLKSFSGRVWYKFYKNIKFTNFFKIHAKENVKHASHHLWRAANPFTLTTHA